MTDTTSTQNKWALLMGIDKYETPGIPQLEGCVSDVDLMAGILRDNFGFPISNITVLRDEQATRDGILGAMNALASRISANDIVVVHYSGHGSQMTDREGDEPDGLDETIVCQDSGRSPYPNRDISDDEIYVWLLGVSQVTPYITLIFDCCHSGNISRDGFGAKSRWLEPDRRPMAELPPSPVDVKVAQGSTREVGPSGWLPLGQRYVLVSGCRDDESSYEHCVEEGGMAVAHGALTYFLSQELVKASAGSTYRDVFERASAQVTATYPRQHPQMEGARDRDLFGVHDIKPMRFVSVTQLSGNKVSLGAGAAQGLTVGSQWAIYPQATKDFADQTLKLAEVKITSVGAVTADATIVNEDKAGAITAGARAVEDAHAYGAMKLVVDLPPSPGHEAAWADLAKEIADSPLLRLAKDGESADARAYLIAPRRQAGLCDPVPQLGAVVKAIWTVVGRDGRLVMPIHTVDEADVAGTLCANLMKIARYRHALALSNPNPGSLLNGKVEFTLKQQATGDTWKDAEPDDAGGQVVYVEGDRIAAEVVNHYTAPIYVSVFDFGLSGAVSLLYPVAGAAEALAPGRSMQIGVRKGDEIELFLPDNFPYLPDPTDTEVAGGIETFKLFATTGAADFSSLAQGAVRGIASPPLQQLLGMALTGHGKRDARPNRLSPNEEWTTVARSFFLQRNSMRLM